MAKFGARFHEWTAPQILMLVNAALFVAGAVLHMGIPLGPMSAPRIDVAAAMESISALVLIAGALAPRAAPRGGWLGAIAANLVALAGIAVGVIALALGAGPRTLSNDIYHVVMTLLAFGALWLLFKDRYREE